MRPLWLNGWRNYQLFEGSLDFWLTGSQFQRRTERKRGKQWLHIFFWLNVELQLRLSRGWCCLRKLCSHNWLINQKFIVYLIYCTWWGSGCCADLYNAPVYSWFTCCWQAEKILIPLGEYLLVSLHGHMLEPTHLEPAGQWLTEVLPAVLRRHRRRGALYN